MLVEHHYRARNSPYAHTTRNVGSRWLGMGCSCLIGAIAGAVFIILVSSLGVRAIQTLAQLPSGQPSVTVNVQEDYLNREASKRINGHFATGVDGITLTALQINVNPNNRLDLRAEFSVNAGFITFNTSAG